MNDSSARIVENFKGYTIVLTPYLVTHTSTSSKIIHRQRLVLLLF